jgi:predicted HTH transcriptional regulator
LTTTDESPYRTQRPTTPIEQSIENACLNADLDAIIQAILAGHVTARSLESVLGLNYQAGLRRLRKLIDAGIIDQSTHGRAGTNNIDSE